MGARQAVLTAVAAWVSFASSTLFGLREGYWAAISAIAVMQSEIAALRGERRWGAAAFCSIAALRGERRCAAVAFCSIAALRCCPRVEAQRTSHFCLPATRCMSLENLTAMTDNDICPSRGPTLNHDVGVGAGLCETGQ
jgi:hypothetical protein